MCKKKQIFLEFLSTHSVRSATIDRRLNHFAKNRFLSTHSVRSATSRQIRPKSWQAIFLSTHSVRSATQLCRRGSAERVISIHALRKECDIGAKWLEGHGEISIHALRKECDVPKLILPFLVIRFLSTHSVRSATSSASAPKRDG